MRTHLLSGLAVFAVASAANAQPPPAPKLVCRSVASTSCEAGYCSTQLDDEPGAQTTLYLDLNRQTYRMSGLQLQPTPMTGVEIGPGSPDHKTFGAKFQIELGHHRPAKVDLYEREEGRLVARATTTFVYPDGIITIVGYGCERDDGAEKTTEP